MSVLELNESQRQIFFVLLCLTVTGRQIITETGFGLHLLEATVWEKLRDLLFQLCLLRFDPAPLFYSKLPLKLIVFVLVAADEGQTGNRLRWSHSRNGVIGVGRWQFARVSLWSSSLCSLISFSILALFCRHEEEKSSPAAFWLDPFDR